jgi:nitroimidazol reductase NimA-like FMN-containing flavoprotein (pyridoxamine 5'-phosphate oxidase superfamily)
MRSNVEQLIRAVVSEGKDLVVATVRPDGAPQATMVSYAGDGLRIYFGTSPQSQKARNLARDERVSIAINLPYRDWSQIRGVSLFGRARRLEDPAELARVGELFLVKFSELAQYVSAGDELALFEVTPEMISLLDYRQGFGHTDLVRVTDAARGLVALQGV